MDAKRRYVVVDDDSVNLVITCDRCNEASRFVASVGHGRIHLYMGNLVPSTESTPVEPEPIEATPVEPEPKTPKAEPEPEPEPEPNNIAAELANEARARRNTQANAALYAIANLVKNRARKNLAFAGKNVIIGRYAKLHGHHVWAIDINHPDVTRILEQYGGKLTLLGAWAEMRVIHTVNRSSEAAIHRTEQVALTPSTRTRCVLFYAKALRNATESTAPSNSELFA